MRDYTGKDNFPLSTGRLKIMTLDAELAITGKCGAIAPVAERATFDLPHNKCCVTSH